MSVRLYEAPPETLGTVFSQAVSVSTTTPASLGVGVVLPSKGLAYVPVITNADSIAHTVIFVDFDATTQTVSQTLAVVSVAAGATLTLDRPIGVLGQQTTNPTDIHVLAAALAQSISVAPVYITAYVQLT